MSVVDKPPYPHSLRELEAYLEPDPRVLVQIAGGAFEADFGGVRGGKLILTVKGAHFDLNLRPLGAFEVGLAFVPSGFTWKRGGEVVQVYYHRSFFSSEALQG